VKKALIFVIGGTIFTGLMAAGGVAALLKARSRPRGLKLEDGVYTQLELGYAIKPPPFAPRAKMQEGGVMIMKAPASAGFSANINVMVQLSASSLEEYEKVSLGQFKDMGMTLTKKTPRKVSGRPAVLWEFEGGMMGRELRFLSLAVVDRDRVYLVTCTGPKDGFETYEKGFRESVDSFRLTR
jgi:hypothetical protein